MKLMFASDIHGSLPATERVLELFAQSGAQWLVHHYAQSGELRRFVIKCRVDNPQSNQVALRNGFILEGCLKQAEFLNDAYDDVNLYARIIDS